MRLLTGIAMLLALFTSTASAQGVTMKVSGDIVVPLDTIHDGTAVAMNGRIRIDGTLRGDAMAMNGDIIVNGTVTGSIRTFNGNIILGQTAVVDGDLWTANGRIDRAPGSRVRGQIQGPVAGSPPPVAAPTPAPGPTPPVAPAPFPPDRPQPMPDDDWWWWSGAMRAVAAWTMAGFVILAGVLAAVIPAYIRRIADTLHKSPAESFLAGMLLWIALPPLIVILALTIVGIPLVAFLPFILILVCVIGFAGLSQLIGDRLLGGFGQEHNAVVEAVVGAALLGALMFIPGLGWLAIGLAVTWGIGAVVILFFRRIRRTPAPA